MRITGILTFVFLSVLATFPSRGRATESLVLATTTSTEDSGLLDAILPDFEKKYDITVKVVAVGTGQALKLARDGNADVVLVHARTLEDRFIAKGFGTDRRDVMYNDFVVLGPQKDSLALRSKKTAAAAFTEIAVHQAPFVSRGDNSGTHVREMEIWKKAGIVPEGGWYISAGQGMGATLMLANEKQAYTLSDRGTYLSMKKRLPGLAVLVGGTRIAENPDPSLRNPYGVIAVNPAKHPHVKYDSAMKFIRWITSPGTQKRIASFGIEKFGQPLFHPWEAKED